MEAGRLIDREGEDIVDWVFGQNAGIDSQSPNQSLSQTKIEQELLVMFKIIIVCYVFTSTQIVCGFTRHAKTSDNFFW